MYRFGIIQPVIKFSSILYLLLISMMLVTISWISSCFKVAGNKSAARPDLQGHRGARALMTENTIRGMYTAIKHGVTTLEMDVVITSERQVILSHEPFFNQKITTLDDGSYLTANNEREHNIYKMTFAETQRYDVGIKPHPDFPLQEKVPATKPLLKQVVDSIIAYCNANSFNIPDFNIETKSHPFTDNIFHPAPVEFVSLLMAVIDASGISDKTTIQSFDMRTLRVVNQIYPGMKTALLIEGNDKRSLQEYIRELSFIPTILSPNHSLVNKSLVDECHAAGIKVIPWTVNTVERMKYLLSIGVDGLISDDPSLYKSL